ncbi:transposase, partial [Streptomyces canarius]
MARRVHHRRGLAGPAVLARPRLGQSPRPDRPATDRLRTSRQLLGRRCYGHRLGDLRHPLDRGHVPRVRPAQGKKKPRPRRSFTPEFKAEIVELCRRGDRSVGQVAKDFDLTETAVRDWLRQAEVD